MELTPLTVTTETSSQGREREHDRIPHTDQVPWAFLSEMSSRTQQWLHDLPSQYRGTSATKGSLSLWNHHLHKGHPLVPVRPKRRRLCCARTMGALCPEPRKKEGNPKRKGAGADTQIYLKGVQMRLSETRSNNRPPPLL